LGVAEILGGDDMSVTITLTKVTPWLGGQTKKLPGSGDSIQGAQYVYEFEDNSSPIKKGMLIFPTSTLLTAGNDGLTGTNTGTIVITDTPG
jgi:hypothetical protein